jgi:hypothetical protein
MRECVCFVEQLQFELQSDFCRALELVEKVQSIFFYLSDSGRIRYLRNSGFEVIEEQQ